MGSNVKRIAAGLIVSAILSTSATAGHGHRGHHGHGWGWGGWWGPAVVGSVIVGGVLYSESVRAGHAPAELVARCARDFPSYNAGRGTIVDANGVERVCPYLL